MYPEDKETPYEKVISVSSDSLYIESPDGHKYTAYKNRMPNPLMEKIVGEWNCEAFTDELHGATPNMTHIFDSNGRVEVLKDGSLLTSGTFKIYDRVIVMLLNGNDEQITPVLWIIKDGVIEDNTMTFFADLSDGTIIENMFTKVVK